MIGVFYADRVMVWHWVEGRYFPGLYFKFPNGRAKCIVPIGRKVTSMYGDKS